MKFFLDNFEIKICKKIKKNIGNIDWQLLTRTTTSTQARFDILYDTIKDIQDTCQPLKTAKLKNDEAWMTPRIKDEIAECQKLYKLNIVEWKKRFNRVRHLSKEHREGHFASHKGKMAEERPVWLFTRQVHHGRNRQSHRQLGVCTGQQNDDSHRLLQLQQSVRPGEPQEADADTQETATIIPHIMDSRVVE